MTEKTLGGWQKQPNKLNIQEIAKDEVTTTPRLF